MVPRVPSTSFPLTHSLTTHTPIAEYIESQAPGVFLKTLRNMQLAVTFFNPLLSLLAISVLPLGEVVAYSETVLERVAHEVGDWLHASLGLGGWINLGRILRIYVSLDAFCVLSGACGLGVNVRGYVRPFPFFSLSWPPLCCPVHGLV